MKTSPLVLLGAVWRGGERWGVDGFLLTLAAAKVVLLWVLITLRWSNAPVPGAYSVSLLVVGGMAAAEALLALWMVCGPGRLALRSLVAVALFQGMWFALAHLYGSSIDFAILAGVALLVAGLVSVVASLIRVGGGWRLVRARDAMSPLGAAWQFRLADLLVMTVTAGLLLMSRGAIADYGIFFYRMGNDVEGAICYGIRCAAFQCAGAALGSMWLLLGKHVRVGWAVALAVLCTLGASLLTSVPSQLNIFPDWLSAAETFTPIGLGSLAVTLGTLLPLRHGGWRIVSVKHRQREAA